MMRMSLYRTLSNLTPNSIIPIRNIKHLSKTFPIEFQNKPLKHQRENKYTS